MTEAATHSETAEHFDVLIVGAGISGVGAAYHLKDQCPDKSFVVIEAYESFGGTWWMHRYPGIRSDSDLYTFGYRFKPWTSAPIATAEEILKYMGEVIDENGLDSHIRYQHRIETAVWSSEENLWTLTGKRSDTGETVRFTANFLWMCQGYYRHAEGYTPEWEGMVGAPSGDPLEVVVGCISLARAFGFGRWAIEEFEPGERLVMTSPGTYESLFSKLISADAAQGPGGIFVGAGIGIRRILQNASV